MNKWDAMQNMGWISQDSDGVYTYTVPIDVDDKHYGVRLKYGQIELLELDLLHENVSVRATAALPRIERNVGALQVLRDGNALVILVDDVEYIRYQVSH